MRLIMTNNKMIMQVHLIIWVVLMMIFHKIMVHKWVIAKIWEAVNNLQWETQIQWVEMLKEEHCK